MVLAARRLPLLQELQTELESDGVQAISVAMDVADETSTISAYDAAEAAFGQVDSVVANAGLSSIGRAIDLPIEEFDRVVAVNLRGVFLTVREGARRMIAKGSQVSDAAGSSSSPPSRDSRFRRAWPPTAPPRRASHRWAASWRVTGRKRGSM